MTQFSSTVTANSSDKEAVSDAPVAGSIAAVRAENATPTKAAEAKPSWKETRRLLAYLAPYKAKFIMALGAVLVATSLGLAFPYLAGHLIDSALPASANRDLPWWCKDVNTVALLLIASLAIQAMFSYLHIFWFNQVGELCLTDLRKQLYARILSLPMSFFASRRVGELSSRLSSDVTQIHDTLIGSVPQFTRQATLLLGGLILIAATSWKLTLVMLSSFPVLVFVAVLVGRQIRVLSRDAQDRLAVSATIVEETLQGIQNVKAFGNEAYERQRYQDQLGGLLGTLLRAARWRAGLVSFIIFGLFGAIVLVLWYGALQMQAGNLSVGELTRFILYTTFVGGAVASFADVYSQIQRTLGATQRVFELMDQEPECDTLDAVAGASDCAVFDRVMTSPTVRLRGDVEFQNVTFSYPGRPDLPVLRNLNLVAKAGENIALVGASGAGKSTAVSLILRFYSPDSGQVLIDGRSAEGFLAADLRRHMAIVPQEVLLFGGSIRENIAYGQPGASTEEILNASRRAFCHDFIMQFPEGYDTLVGERGVKLSGGQRQRIAIARALLKDPAILILDEATSALDSENERLVQQALEQLIAGRTTFIIAHRLSTVRRVNRIYVLENGSVAETGTHEELMQKEGGVYRRNSEIQFGLV
ncbi:MAG TPA: ABC transporter transmembrane domain-containing protein [Candidatus Methylacidiphilales bacterium]|nr:ABC transporter transmembrane domain-containing protein [Candidatus Methylacidiphilales bacterium]